MGKIRPISLKFRTVMLLLVRFERTKSWDVTRISPFSAKNVHATSKISRNPASLTLQRITRESLRFQRVAVPPFRRGISVVNPMEDDASKVASLCSLLSSRRVSPNAQWARDRKYSFDSRSDVFDRVYRMKLDEQPMKLLRPMILFFFFSPPPFLEL